MRRYTKSLSTLLALCVFMVAAFGALEAQQRITIQANAKGTSTQLGQMVAIKIIIDGVSPPEDRDAIIAGFQKDGTDGMRSALEKLKPKGRISPQRSVGNDVKYIRELPAENGMRRFRLVTDRNLGFAEMRNMTRSSDYSVGALEVTISADGKNGSGTVLPACKLMINKKTNELEIETYQNPWKLENFMVYFD